MASTPSLPQTQKSIIFNTETNTLSLSTTAPLPSLGPHPTEHLIAVHSTAITNGELTWAPFCNWPTLHVPCYDVSGTVLSTVPGSKFNIGDKIYGRVTAYREGTARQYATILPSEMARVPQGVGMREASSMPMSAFTAWQALFEQGGLCGDLSDGDKEKKEGEKKGFIAPYVSDEGEVIGGQAKGKRVLILGAAGGVGLMAVQFAKIAGAWVAGTASSKNTEFLKELGIDEVIDYTQTSIASYIGSSEDRKFDLVFDCVGGKSMLDGWAAVKAPGGTYVSIVPGFREPEGGKPEGVKSKWFVMEARGEELEGIGKLVEKGLVKGCVDSVWKLEEFEEAFAKTAGGHARGKVVLAVADGEE